MRRNTGALIAAVGVEFQQERIHTKRGRHDQCTTFAILNVGCVNDGVDQQALRVNKNVPLLALDFLSRVLGTGTAHHKELESGLESKFGD